MARSITATAAASFARSRQRAAQAHSPKVVCGAQPLGKVVRADAALGVVIVVGADGVETSVGVDAETIARIIASGVRAS